MTGIIDLPWVHDLLLTYGPKADGKMEAGELYGPMMAHLLAGLNASGGCLAIRDEVFFDLLRIVATYGWSPHAADAEMAVGDGVLGYVAKHGKALLFDGKPEGNAPCWASDLRQYPADTVVVSAMCLPLQSDGKTFGALLVSRSGRGSPFTEVDLECGRMLANLIAMSINNVRIHSRYMLLRATLEALNQEIYERNVQENAMSKRLEDTQVHLMQSEKMASIGQLAAGVAHEINNPIGYVSSNLGTLEKYVEDVVGMLDSYEQAEGAIADEELRSRLQAARKKLDIAFLKDDLHALLSESKDGIVRVKQIVQNLKDFSHADASDEWIFADLHKGLDSTLNIVNNEIKYKASVIREYGDIPEVECLASQLNQVFMNLLVNAAHAIEERGTITIRTGSQGDEVWVEIEDTGKGIAPEHMQKIFDPFFTTKPIGKGTGLGLSLSYGIIQKHHGRIEVQSEAGKGTTFRVRLPVRQAVAQQETA